MKPIVTADDLRDVELLDPTDAAVEAGLSVARIVQLADLGELPSKRTRRGRRLFLLPDVRLFLQRRSDARRAVLA